MRESPRPQRPSRVLMTPSSARFFGSLLIAALASTSVAYGQTDTGPTGPSAPSAAPEPAGPPQPASPASPPQPASPRQPVSPPNVPPPDTAPPPPPIEA